MTWTRLTPADGRPYAVVDGDTLDAAEPTVWARFRTAEAAYRAAMDECPYPAPVVRHIPQETPMTTTPPPPPVRFHGLWDDLEQARRAWAITQASRVWSGKPGNMFVVEADADGILRYVTGGDQ